MLINQILLTINDNRRLRIMQSDDIQEKLASMSQWGIKTISVRVTDNTSPRSHYKSAKEVYRRDFSSWNMECSTNDFLSLVKGMLGKRIEDEALQVYANAYIQDTVSTVSVELDYKMHDRVGCQVLTDEDNIAWFLSYYTDRNYTITNLRVVARNNITTRFSTLFSIRKPENIVQYTKLIKALFQFAKKEPFRVLESDYFWHCSGEKEKFVFAAVLNNKCGVLMSYYNDREFLATLSARFTSVKRLIMFSANRRAIIPRFIFMNENLWDLLAETSLIMQVCKVKADFAKSLAGVIFYIRPTWLQRNMYRRLADLNRCVIKRRKSIGTTQTKNKYCYGLTPKQVFSIYHKHNELSEVEYNEV